MQSRALQQMGFAACCGPRLKARYHDTGDGASQMPAEALQEAGAKPNGVA